MRNRAIVLSLDCPLLSFSLSDDYHASFYFSPPSLSISLSPIHFSFPPSYSSHLNIFFSGKRPSERLSLRGQSCPLIAPFVNSAIASHNKRRRNVSPGGLILPLDSIMTTRLINVSDYAPPRHFFFFFFQSFLLI